MMYHILCTTVENMAQSEAKQLTFEYRNQLQSGVVCVVNVEQEKATFLIAVTDDLVKSGIKAGMLVKTACEGSNGRGGGKPDFAQGGTKELDKVIVAIEAIKRFYSSII